MIIKKTTNFIISFLWITNLLIYIIDTQKSNVARHISWIIKGILLLSYLPLRILSIPLQYASEYLILKIYNLIRPKIILDNNSKLTNVYPYMNYVYIIKEFNRLIYVLIILLILTYNYKETIILGFIGLSLKIVIFGLITFYRFDTKNNKVILF